MRVLGLDPGLADTGWALLEQSPLPAGSRLVSSGLLRTEASLPLPERLRRLHEELSQILRDCRPETVAVEEMFFLKAAHTVRASLQARGVILLAASQAGIPISEYNPRHVKSTLTGSGAASKAQIQKMIQRSLDLEKPLRPDDVADAAAIALCHLRAGRFKRLRVLERIGARA